VTDEIKPEFTKEYVEGLRNEAAGHRMKAQDVQLKMDGLATEHAALKARFETADAARVTAESAALDARTGADARIISAELKVAARDAGLIDADDLRLVDVAKLKLVDGGVIEGLGELVEGLKTTKPHLFRTAEVAGQQQQTNSNSNPANPPSPKAPEAKHARDMTADEYSAERARITAGR
jgi:hypothetical protein